MDTSKLRNEFVKKETYFPGYISDEQKRSLVHMESCGEFICTKNYITNRKEYNTFLFYYVIEGKSYLKYKDINKVLYKGDAFLIDCYPHQIYGADKKEPCSIIYAHFNGGCARYYYDKIVENKGYILSSSDAEIVANGMKRLLKQTKKTSKHKVEKLSNIVHQMLNDLMTLNIKEDSPYEIAAQFARRCINENKSLSVTDMANSVGYSKYHFTNKFTSYFGIAPYEFIIKERIELCKSKLVNSTSSIGAIALDLSFADTAHLTNCFKKRVGVTPSEYRAKWRV